MSRTAKLLVGVGAVAGGALAGFVASKLASRTRPAYSRAPLRATDTQSSAPTPAPDAVPVALLDHALDKFGEVVRDTVTAIVNPAHREEHGVVREQVAHEMAERLVDGGFEIPAWFLDQPAQPEYRDPTDLDAPLDAVWASEHGLWEGGPIEFPTSLPPIGGNGRAAFIAPGENPFEDIGLDPPPPTPPGG